MLDIIIREQPTNWCEINS